MKDSQLWQTLSISNGVAVSALNPMGPAARIPKAKETIMAIIVATRIFFLLDSNVGTPQNGDAISFHNNILAATNLIVEVTQ
ncbi:MAG: hypothetical protein KJ970_19660 [Candidatus Eisenbacteria bacterium]|uniref:Uncharacterized protein n=1 Tax=Eiseniibacteriota bacterium TaxID=2212470 RepID=A0A948RY25_UNCEI|nr:hypothetical protein [Candidatus Eisenbacteria bacterium]